MDVNMDDGGGSGDASRRRNAPRLYHKKSRMGCIRCKQRRVKCDEKKPDCGGCSRHGVECVYPGHAAPAEQRLPWPLSPDSSARPSEQDLSPPSGGGTQGHTPDSAHSPAFVPMAPSPALSSAAAPHSPLSVAPTSVATASSSASASASQPSLYGDPALPGGTAAVPKADDDEDSVQDPPESRERRLWELRLQHNYMEILYAARQAERAISNPPLTFLWTVELPQLAFSNDSILYGTFAHSALNLWAQATDAPEREHLRMLQRTYLGMALREQRKMVATLGRDNADALCISSLLILSHSFALVQTTLPEDGDVSAWQAPVEWLRLGRGTGTLFTVARALLPNGPDNVITRYLNSPPHFDPDEIFKPENRADLMWILDLDRPSREAGGGGAPLSPAEELEEREAADKITRRVYERVLCYTGWVKRAVDRGEARFSVQRRLAAFAVWIGETFEEFCQQRRARALVSLAWFFSLWIPYDDMWTINGTGKKQVRAIYQTLEPRWRVKLEPIMTQHQLV